MITTKTPRAVAAKRRVPQPRSDSDETRERILDSAEKLFARFSYQGASIREIAADASCQSALVGYHFGSKLDLMDKVLARRSEVLNTERLAFLERARVQAGDAPIGVRTLLEGYVGTIVRRASRSDPGWRNYTQMIGATASNAEWSELTDKHFNTVAREYMRELQRSLPELPAESLHHAFSFAIGVMVNVCARPGRIETLSKGEFKSKDVSAMYENLCTFLEGGFNAMAGRSTGEIEP
jgi:AcrR family transcriptional regulator